MYIDNNFKIEVGERLKKLRVKKGYTQEDVIDNLEKKFNLVIGIRTLRRYEKGYELPKIDNLIELCNLYETTLDYIIYGKETSDDNSYKWADNLKRISRLIYPMILIIQKETNINSDFYGKYYLFSLDEEVNLFLEKVENYMREKVYEFDVRNGNPNVSINDLDLLIGKLNDYDEEVKLSMERLNYLLKSNNIDPNEYAKERFETILRKRKL